MNTDQSETSDRRQQILEAALLVFSSKGFHKATNKDIADAAGGISPGLIYHYFKDKEDLFMSLIRERAPILQLSQNPERFMELPMREALAVIGRAYLTMLSNPANAALFRILIGEITRFPQLGDLLYRRGLVRLFHLIQTYLQHQVDLGNLRPHDTMISTRSFLGMFVVHILAREILHQPEALAADPEHVIDEAIAIFLHGLTPR